MIEYLYNAIRATAGEDVCICAKITEETQERALAMCSLMIHDDENMICCVDGEIFDDLWEFYIPAEDTVDLKGRYWYCIKYMGETICFKQPIYFI